MGEPLPGLYRGGFMAAFANETDVEALLQRTYTATSHPNSTQIGNFLDQRSAMIRGLLKIHNLAESALDSDALSLLLKVTTIGAAYDAESAAVMKGNPILSERGRELKNEWDEWYEMIKDNPGVISSQDRPSTGIRSRADSISARDASTAINNEKWEPRMRMDEDW